MKRLYTVGLVLAALLAAASSATAQEEGDPQDSRSVQEAGVVDVRSEIFHAWGEERTYFRPEIYRLTDAASKTGIKLGPGRLHLLTGFQAMWDSNALYSESSSIKDWVFSVIPGADYLWTGRRIDLATGYRFTYRNNLREDSQDNDAHAVTFNGTYRLSRRISLTVSNNFEMTADPADLQVPERLDRLTNELSGEVKYRTNAQDLETSVRYTDRYQRFEGQLPTTTVFNDQISRDSVVNVSTRFKAFPQTFVGASLEYLRRDFDQDPSLVYPNNDSWGIGGHIGLGTRITRNLDVAMDAGVSSLSFANDTETLGFAGSATVMFRASRRSSLIAGYQRTLQAATFTDFYNDDRAFFGTTWNSGRRLSYDLRVIFDWVDYSRSDTNVVGPDQDDFVTQVATNVSYSLLEWCIARIGYNLELRDSAAADPAAGVESGSFTKHGVVFGFDARY